MGTYYLQTEKLSVGYEKISLIDEIEIALEPGHILALIGPNGAGKSTILKTLSGQLEKIGGRIVYKDSDLENWSRHELARQMALVSTERVKTERMSAAEVVASGRYPYTGSLGLLRSADHAMIREAIELVQIADFAGQDFMRLSDGQRQRVMLARAICQQPDVLILDEPTSFLDIHYQLEYLQILRELALKKNISILISLHELSLAQKIADEVICVKGKHITHYGTAEEVFRSDLIRDLYDLEGSYNPLFGNLEMKAVQGEAKHFVIAGNGRGIPVFRKLQQKGIPFSCGILHENDIDYVLARDLAVRVYSEAPFRVIGAEVYARALEAARASDVLICALREQDFGPGNEKNRELLAAARGFCSHIYADGSGPDFCA